MGPAWCRILRSVALAMLLAGASLNGAEGQPLPVERVGALKPGEAFRECEACPEMVVVPSGEFLMGAAAGDATGFDLPQHAVRIGAPFAVSRFEITVEQYAAFARDSGHAVSRCVLLEDSANGRFNPRDDRSWQAPGFPQGGTHPVTCVSWADAKAYVAWLARTTGKSYRLLSEAEWEYAARAGSTTRYPFGADANSLCLHGNGADETLRRQTAALDLPEDLSDIACSDNHLRTAPVGSFPANGFGLHDMLGNVAEWVEDCNQTMETGRGYEGAPADGSAWTGGSCSGRGARGGHWGADAKELQSNARGGGPRAEGADFLGIRVARTLAP
ncbi:formylglycine-generating enzyme family protein [Phreatobacter stygius]|uniref:Formylglycine-generating enzyme family protein n=1 Tax=Phreatobacter stygius TaxID=1940610 RepID=A0A4D7B0H2_9HYPH|nr:formylglycine-generating enzyme family protein [Phreatobacter stygius]QCI67154.1 formylglycine-generating enzyme family protein [Phreatobacter stygius]